MFYIYQYITITFKVILIFYFLQFWVCHAVNYIMPPSHMLVCQTVRNVGLSQLAIPFSGVSATFFTLKITKNLEEAMLPVNCWS